MAPGQQTGQEVLHIIGVLILVHQNVAEAALIILPDLLVVLQELDGIIDDIVKIQGVILSQLGLVAAVALGDLGHAHVALLPGGFGALLGRDHPVLLPGDDGEDHLGREGLLVQAHILQNILHDALGIGGIVDGEAPCEAQQLDVPAQDPAAGSVEGHGPDLGAFAAQHGAEPLLQLSGGLIGEGDGHDLPGGRSLLPAKLVCAIFVLGAQHRRQMFQKFHIGLGCSPGRGLGFVAAAEADQIGDPVDEDRGLAAACTGQQQQGAFRGQGGGPLHGVQGGKLGFNISPPGGEKTFFKCMIHIKHLLSMVSYPI